MKDVFARTSQAQTSGSDSPGFVESGALFVDKILGNIRDHDSGQHILFQPGKLLVLRLFPARFEPASGPHVDHLLLPMHEFFSSSEMGATGSPY